MKKIWHVGMAVPDLDKGMPRSGSSSISRGGRW